MPSRTLTSCKATSARSGAKAPPTLTQACRWGEECRPAVLTGAFDSAQARSIGAYDEQLAIINPMISLRVAGMACGDQVRWVIVKWVVVQMIGKQRVSGSPAATNDPFKRSFAPMARVRPVADLLEEHSTRLRDETSGSGNGVIRVLSDPAHRRAIFPSAHAAMGNTEV